MPSKKTYFALLGLAATSFFIAGCASVGNAAQEPQLAPIQDPSRIVGYMPLSMPSPNYPPETYAPNSLWRTGARGFFKDQRAGLVGDILTVEIKITDTAQLSNTTAASRTGNQTANVGGLFGLESPLERALPGQNSLNPGLNLNSNSTTNGTGSVNRTETINLTVAAVITDVLQNGNFVIAGRQEVKVNAEVRELLISGIIRPEDISANNTIDHTQIAEARISYGGRGDLTRMQRPRVAHRAIDAVFPF